MSSIELFDELEAGELSIQFEGEEPQAVLEWAIAEFMPSIAISTSFQIDSVVADRHGLRDRSQRARSSASTPAASRTRPSSWPTACATRYPGPAARARRARRRTRSPAMTGKHGVDLFKTRVDLRLLCCNLRKVRPLTKHLHGARRVGHRPAPRPVGEPHEHPQGRDRPRPRRDREAQPARRVGRGRGLGLRPRAGRSVPLALRPGLHLDRLRARARARSSRARRAAPAAGGGSRTRRRSAASTARSRAAASSTSCTRCSARTRMPEAAVKVRVSGEAAEVATRRGAGRARDGAERGAPRPARRPRRRDRRRRGRRRRRRRARGAARARAADRPHPRRSTAPRASRPSLALFRRLPLGRELTESTRELNEALQALEGQHDRARGGHRSGPGRVWGNTFDRRLRAGAPPGEGGRKARDHRSVK